MNVNCTCVCSIKLYWKRKKKKKKAFSKKKNLRTNHNIQLLIDGQKIDQVIEIVFFGVNLGGKFKLEV